MRYENPILPGFYPDPSVCRVGRDFYAVCSSFEYFPGVPIFHSRDLVHWRQLGHALTRESQLDLTGAPSSAGIFAPTLRYHRGTFYLITTNVSGRGNFYVTTSDPAGAWSEPVWLDEPNGGIDPSLLFDDDGRVYYTRHAGGERGGVVQAELDLSRGKVIEPARPIWSGTGGIWPEGPHLYRVGEHYYLLIAEGGTGYGHSVTVARSRSPWGPFEPCPHNPILSHRERQGHPIQATGHADLVQTENGDWWMLLLGIRPRDGKHHHLGRETFLAPVSWSDDGWPIVNRNQPLELAMESARLPKPAPWPAQQGRDDFEATSLAPCWNFLRNPSSSSWSLRERPGRLRLVGSAASLDEVGAPAFVGRRQQDFACRASTLLELLPLAHGQEAGLCVRANEANHYDLAVLLRDDGKRVARLRQRVQGVSSVVGETELADGATILSIEATAESYELFAAKAGGDAVLLGKLATAPLSSEAAGGFTGVYFGMYATSGGSEPMPPADFDWFEYHALPG